MKLRRFNDKILLISGKEPKDKFSSITGELKGEQIYKYILKGLINSSDLSESLTRRDIGINEPVRRQ